MKELENEKREKISDSLGHIRPEYVEEAADPSPLPVRAVPGRTLRRVILAAALVLALAIAGTAFAFAAEAKEYQTALNFFEENGISSEGLSRSDVKAVYRDITTRRFTNEKTEQVIRESVLGQEIQVIFLTPEKLAELWDRKDTLRLLPVNGIGYTRVAAYRRETDQTAVFEGYDLTCYKNREPVWTVRFPESDMSVDGYVYLSGKTVVWGARYNGSQNFTQVAWVACLDESGNSLWKYPLRHETEEIVCSVLDNGDGTWEIVSHASGESGDWNQLLRMTRIQPDGTELTCVSTQLEQPETGTCVVQGASLFGDGYLVRLTWNHGRETTCKLIWVDRDGRISETLELDGEDCDYYVQDMIEYAGKVYFSAYAVPKAEDGSSDIETARMFDRALAWFDGEEITDSEITEIARNTYTAVLLVCDPETFAPTSFYSVNGALGGKLLENSLHQLEWEVQDLSVVWFSPATSSFSFYGSCEVFRYTFDDHGNLIGSEDTGHQADYRR